MNYFEAGNRHFDNGEYKEAIENYLKELTDNPQDIKTLINLSVSYYELEDYENSLDITNQILKLKPKNIEALVNRGNCYQALHMFSQAEADFSTLIDIDSTTDIYYFNRANARRYLGDFKGEESDRRKYESITGENLDPIFSTDAIDAIEDLDLDEFNKSKRRFIQITAKDPGNYSAYLDLGIAYSKILAHQSAINAYSKALTLHPKQIDDKILFNRANAYFDNRQYEECLNDINTYNSEYLLNPDLEELKAKIEKLNHQNI